MTYGGADIVEEARRLTQQRLSESAEHRRRTAAELRELNERTVRNLRQTIEDLNSRNREEQKYEEAKPSAEEASGPLTTVEEFQPGAEELLRQQREAIHRSVSSRQSRNIVTPIDDDGDDEAEYYRRRSWLV